MKDFSKLCTPAKIYFAIAVIATIFALLGGVSFMAAFIKLIFAFIWTFVLGWLCDKGFTSISWFLVLLPYIIILCQNSQLSNVVNRFFCKKKNKCVTTTATCASHALRAIKDTISHEDPDVDACLEHEPTIPVYFTIQ